MRLLLLIAIIGRFCFVNVTPDDPPPGEMGPAMLIVTEQADGANAPSTAQQAVQLHAGWNLVSWNLELPDDPFPPPDLTISEVVGADENPDPLSNYFGAANPRNRIYWYDHDYTAYYPHPNYVNQPWDRQHAYYVHFDQSHAWNITAAPQTLGTITFTPNSAWANDPNIQEPNVGYWFFMGYAAPGYCKLASIPNIEGTTGDPQNFDYEGPFHWLFWNQTSPYRPRGLKIIKTDDGRVYIPSEDFDNIGVLEPGKGYFLGFSDNNAYNFEGWAGWSQWRNQNVINPDPKSSNNQIASADHFQFNKYTHWSYPVVIDTVNLLETPLAEGDEIGVFDGDRCVGAAEYEDKFPLIISAWEDDIITEDSIDGYIEGHEMTFVWFDASSNTEVEFTPPPGIMGVEDDPVCPDHSGFGAGLYGMRSFVYGIQSVLQLPSEFALKQNFPNPFNAETVIPLELPQRSHVKIELFNVRGQCVCLIFEGMQNAGYPKIRYNASQLSSGMYFCRVTAEGLEREGKFSSVSKMVVLK